MFEYIHELIQKRDDGLVFIEVNGEKRKPEIIDFLLETGRLQGFRILVASSNNDPTSSYYLWRRVFGKLFGFKETDSYESRQEKVIKFLEQEPDVQVFSPLFNEILDLQIPEAILTSHLPVSERGKLLHLLMIETIRIACLESPLLIIIDVVERLDSESWKLIHQINDALECVQFVAFRHQHYLESNSNLFKKAKNYEM